MEKLNLLEFIKRLKIWEEEHTISDHGEMIVGSRERKPVFPEAEKELDEKD